MVKWSTAATMLKYRRASGYAWRIVCLKWRFLYAILCVERTVVLTAAWSYDDHGGHLDDHSLVGYDCLLVKCSLTFFPDVGVDSSVGVQCLSDILPRRRHPAGNGRQAEIDCALTWYASWLMLLPI